MAKRTKAHARSCECRECLTKYMTRYAERVKHMTDLKAPKKGATIPVAAHFRRHPGHLKKRPRAKKAVNIFIQSFFKGFNS